MYALAYATLSRTSDPDNPYLIENQLCKECSQEMFNIKFKHFLVLHTYRQCVRQWWFLRYNTGNGSDGEEQRPFGGHWKLTLQSEDFLGV